MPKINKVYPPFTNGVSQQSNELMLDNQCKEMINCVPDLVKGLSKRPPLTLAKKWQYEGFDVNTYYKLGDEFADATVFHSYDRGEDDEEYVFLAHTPKTFTDPSTGNTLNSMSLNFSILTKDSHKAVLRYTGEYDTHNFTGTALVDEAEDIWGYLATAYGFNNGSRPNLKALTVQDRTWLYNTDKVVGILESDDNQLDPYYEYTAFYWLKRGSGDRYNPFNYAVYLNGTTIGVNPDKPEQGGTNVTDPPTGAEDTDFAARDLQSKINGDSKNTIKTTVTVNYSQPEYRIHVGYQYFSYTMSPSNATYSSWEYDYWNGDIVFYNFYTTSPADPSVITFSGRIYGFDAEVSGSIIKIQHTKPSMYPFEEISYNDSWIHGTLFKGYTTTIGGVELDFNYVKLRHKTTLATTYIDLTNASQCFTMLNYFMSDEYEILTYYSGPTLGIESYDDFGYTTSGSGSTYKNQDGVKEKYLKWKAILFTAGQAEYYTPTDYGPDSWLWLRSDQENPLSFDFSSWDSWGNQASEGWKGSVNKITDLPKDMPFKDVYVKIQGDENSEFTDYFVKWNGSSWEECKDPLDRRGSLTNMPIKLDRQAKIYLLDYNSSGITAAREAGYTYLKIRIYNQYYSLTVPIGTEQEFNDAMDILYYHPMSAFVVDGTYYSPVEIFDIPSANAGIYFYNESGSYQSKAAANCVGDVQVPVFSLQLIDWSEPTVGNEDNNPNPSFAGQPIQDLFFHKNRLGIASADSISLTEAANYTNFYATTAIDILETDAIDITIASNQASKIHYAKPFNNALYVFTAYSQYELTYEGVFAPNTVSLENTSNYPMNTKVEPIVVNDSLYFISTSGNQQQLREYIKTDKLNVKGIDLNLATPTYLDIPITKIVADGVLNYIICCTDTNKVYLYNYKEDSDKRIQSAWSTWSFLEPLVEENNTTFEYEKVGSNFFAFFKGNDHFNQFAMQFDDITSTTIDKDGITEYAYECKIVLPDYYPKLTEIRTPKDKTLIKKVIIQGEGTFDAEVYRKDYDKIYLKNHAYGLKDLDLHIASKVGNVEITLKDSTSNNFNISSVIVEGLYNPTSKEMR